MAKKSTRDRRTVLKATGLTLAGVSLSGCISSATPQGQDASNASKSPTETSTTSPSSYSDVAATVKVGPNENYKFVPETVQVKPGSTVKWVWRSDNHSIVVESQPEKADWQGTPGKHKLYDSGYTYTHTFDILGKYDYYCRPHKALDATGAIVVTKDPTGQPNHTPTLDREYDTCDGTLTIAVGLNGNYTFEPGTQDPAVIPPGTKVTFIWKSDTNNIVVQDQPQAADWNGVEETHGEGYASTHVFNTKGRYHFYSAPHKTLGMVGDIIVK